MASKPPDEKTEKPKETELSPSVPSFKVKAWSGEEREMTLNRLNSIFNDYQKKVGQIQLKVKNLTPQTPESIPESIPESSPAIPTVPTPSIQTQSKPTKPEQFTKPLTILSKNMAEVSVQINEAENAKNEESLKNAYAFFLKKSPAILVIMFVCMEKLGMPLPPNRPTFKRINRARIAQELNAASTSSAPEITTATPTPTETETVTPTTPNIQTTQSSAPEAKSSEIPPKPLQSQ